MTKPKPTPEQIQRACDLLDTTSGILHGYNPHHYGANPAFTVLADTIAQLDAMEDKADAANVRANNMRAERDKAVADLREIDRLLGKVGADTHRLSNDSRGAIGASRSIAAPYRVETDPLVEAFRSIHSKDIEDGVDWSVDIARRLRTELAKRGIEL